jgi:hypothetical protein
VSDEPGPYIAIVERSNGFRRRLFFEGPPGQEGREAFAPVQARARALGDQFDDMEEACDVLRRYASAFGFQGIAR